MEQLEVGQGQVQVEGEGEKQGQGGPLGLRVRTALIQVFVIFPITEKTVMC